jgi:TrpR-related protein YerC/YecD
MKTHRNLTPRQEALAERNLCAAIAALRTADECRAFFRDLCTPAELQAMADRWAVIEFLQRGVPYREIQRITGVSVTTIGRVARFLANGNGGYAIAVRRLEDGKAEPGQRRTISLAEVPAARSKRLSPLANRHG